MIPCQYSNATKANAWKWQHATTPTKCLLVELLGDLVNLNSEVWEPGFVSTILPFGNRVSWKETSPMPKKCICELINVCMRGWINV